MNTLLWFLALLSLGLLAGAAVGALLAFTRGRVTLDLAAGLLGALAGGVLLRFAGAAPMRDALPSLLAGLCGAMLAAWLTRVVTWPPEPKLGARDRRPVGTIGGGMAAMMTTSEGTRLLLSGDLIPLAAREVPVSAS